MSGLRGNCIPVGLYEGRGVRGVKRGGLIKMWTFYKVDTLYKDDKNAVGRWVFFIASRMHQVATPQAGWLSTEPFLVGRVGFGRSHPGYRSLRSRFDLLDLPTRGRSSRSDLPAGSVLAYSIGKQGFPCAQHSVQVYSECIRIYYDWTTMPAGDHY